MRSRSFMLYFIGLLILAALLHVAVHVKAQSGYPTGYQVVFAPPAANMRPLSATCILTIYDVSMGTLNKITVPAQVDGYVLWSVPPRQPDYYVSFIQNGTRNWTILSPQSLDAICQ